MSNQELENRRLTTKIRSWIHAVEKQQCIMLPHHQIVLYAMGYLEWEILKLMRYQLQNVPITEYLYFKTNYEWIYNTCISNDWNLCISPHFPFILCFITGVHRAVFIAFTHRWISHISLRTAKKKFVPG